MDTAASDTPPAAELVRWLDALKTLSAAATSEMDPREVLHLVAATARSLLGFDFCGVLTPDRQRRDLVITGWSGLSADYVARTNSDHPVRLDSTAPSSRAFHSGRPVAIRDITAEAGFAPWGGVARAEGYRAIVCVPLVAGNNVLGTLNGYYRPEHTFADAEIEQLTLLANHAAIALTSARMLDELRGLTASLLEQRDALARSERIHQRLLAVTLRSGGVDGIAAVLTELVGRTVLIEDARHEMLAVAGDPAALPGAAQRRTAAIDPDASSTPVRVAGDAPAGPVALVSTARLNGEVAARIWIPEDPEPPDTIGVRAIEHASIVVALELLRVRTGVEVEHRLRGELLAELLTGPAAPTKQLMARATLLGHDLGRPHTAMVGSLGATEPSSGRAFSRSLSAVSDALRSYRPRPLAAMYRGDIVVLWPTGAQGAGAPTAPAGSPAGVADAAALVQRTMAAAGGSATVAVYGFGIDVDKRTDGYAHAYRVAKGALDIAVRSGRTNTVVPLDDLGLAGLLLQLEDTAQLIAFADRTLGPVLDYDGRHRTELLDTLRTYLACRLDRASTATRLHIHPNTVGQRVRRIEQLCSADLTDPSVTAHFSTALTVRDVALRHEAG
ncbi:MAG: GAF domain-containing protein [Actinobacteria bacterium]|nr:GAF domain-containing protein [Actinomycetota bacterium]